MFSLKKEIFAHPFFLLSFAFFLLRLVHLTALPIFNDESIYLDWGWRETHESGYLFYSLYDAKQPLLMWIFGISQSIFDDPLFAGRLVSVLAGFLTMAGIYRIGKRYFSKETGILVSLLYITVPIFSFFDRQALMESAISAIGVWSCYFFLSLLTKPAVRSSVFLGTVLGVGFFIKSSSLMFFFSSFVIFFFLIFRRNDKKKFLSLMLLTLLTMFAIDSLLLLQPFFWKTLETNARFSLSAGEILAFPISLWFKNITGNLEIIGLFLTPLVAFAIIPGIYAGSKEKKSVFLYFFFWTVLTVIIETFLTRNTSQRYLVSFLPPLLFFSVSGILFLANAIRIDRRYLFSFFLIVPFTFTLIQINNHVFYFKAIQFSHYSDYASYMTDMTSGNGVPEVLERIKAISEGKPIFVGIARNTGNPESAMLVYFEKDNVIRVGYFDSYYFGNRLKDVECFSADLPIYFVSRGTQQAGLEKFMENITVIKNPYGSNSIGIYRVKESCLGKKIQVQFKKT